MNQIQITKRDEARPALIPNAACFVLRFDKDPAARAALQTYIDVIQDEQPDLAATLQDWLLETAPQREAAPAPFAGYEAGSFFVPGEPRAKQSFRVTQKGGKTGGFQPARLRSWQEAIGWEAKQAGFKPDNLLTGEIGVSLTFYLPTHRKMDLDNLSKAVMDGMNGVVWEDDQQVIELRIRKFYRPARPGVAVRIVT